MSCIPTWLLCGLSFFGGFGIVLFITSITDWNEWRRW